jgi:cytochrome c
MKTLLASILVATGVLVSGAAHASADLANANCGKCHEMDKKKKGPSYKAIAAKFKGREGDALKAVDPKADHPEFKAKDEDVRAIVKWILAQ